MSIKAEDFEIYQTLLKEQSGLVITPDKAYLLESRLNPIARKWNLDSIDALTGALRGSPDKGLVTDVIEAMTTNETSFFRDIRPFEIFKEEALSYMIKARESQKQIKIWCAAASSGQEPYTVNMVMKEQKDQLDGWRLPIKATDISHEILEQAKRGIYSQFEVQRGLPIQMLMSYFKQQDDKWAVKDDLKTNISYEYFNLLDDMGRLGTFDIIFCRNVLIYFDEATKGDVLDRMAKILAPDGFLFLGGAETVLGITEAFKPLPDKRGLYVRDGSPHLQSTATPSGSAASLAS